MRVKSLNTRDFYARAMSRFEEVGAAAHKSSGEIFVIAEREDGVDYQVTRFRLRDYPVHAMLGPLLPRLDILAACGLADMPKSLAHKWRLPWKQTGQFLRLHVEITFLAEEQAGIVAGLPAVIEMLERGERGGFEAAFGLSFAKFSEHNIWTEEANRFARDAMIANGQLRRKP